MTTDSTDGRARGDDAHEAAAMPPSYPPRSAPGPERAQQGSVGGRTATSRGGWFRETLTVMVSALILSVLIKTFLAQAFYIPSGSMENTLELGDRVMVNKLAPGPFELDRGDIVVFVDPGDWLGELPPDTRPAWQRTATQVLTWIGLLPQDAGHHLIKRIIGTGGDTVECCDAQGRLMVNGEPIDEPYLKPGTEPSEMEFSVTVPEDHVWLMGDNRSNSADSRAHLGDPGGGSVPVKNIVGRAFVVLWPADRITLLDNPEKTFAHVPEPSP
ncbi:signal peptidase I [Georgenia soli]|uniref:Signal peptidase I n=1 Tax=Georgenia soli TaxID=638953 RepID=A0A2A9EJU2_9MICO|nr:signal peptidase I [Georgenia soli]PFG38499.1 signal peptidase I [Georgenia soli]